jgi:hypothetical protein
LKIMIGVQPVTGRLAEARYRMDRQLLRGQVQFNASVPFERQELWRATIFLTGSSCSGKASATVEVTPPGYGAWDLLSLSPPFAGLGCCEREKLSN